jgi:hypothetical protein
VQLSFITFDKNGNNDFHNLGMDCRVFRVSSLEQNISLESLKKSTYLKMNLAEFYYI